tara:strand:+ start:103117 stop:104112 length:996 start_codon:yes stop_codon:yes gene_type:complete
MKIVLSIAGVVLALLIVFFIDREVIEVEHNTEDGCENLELTKRVEEGIYKNYGLRIPPNTKGEFEVLLDGKILTSGKVNTDQYHRRLSGVKQTDNAFVLFGASVLFGTGVSDEETIAYVLQSKVNEHSVYNYASRATAPNNIYHFLKNHDLRPELPHGNFHFVYVQSHATAYSVDAAPEYSGWMHLSPWYSLEEGKLVHKGVMEDRPYHKKYLELAKSGTYRNSGLSTELSNDEVYELTCHLYTGIRKELIKQFPKAKFSVVNFPLSNNEKEIEYISSCLKKDNIPFFNFAEMLKEMDEGSPEFVFPCLDHYTPKSSDALSDLFIKMFDLK